MSVLLLLSRLTVLSGDEECAPGRQFRKVYQGTVHLVTPGWPERAGQDREGLQLESVPCSPIAKGSGSYDRPAHSYPDQ